MTGTLAEKILKAHLVEGRLKPGETIALKMDQTLTQDATGTMAYLQFEALGIPIVKTELSVSYIDHNTLQTGFRNADDHNYLQSVAAKYNIKLSKAGNGICHQVHLERFAKPGKTLIGSDSHTPTAGGVGMLGIGAGGLDVAVAMAGNAFYLKMPRIVGVKLAGKLGKGVSAKDVILEILRKIGVRGGVGKLFEYFGSGVSTLDVPSRATITNMGTETGATTSIFPADKVTKKFLKLMERPQDYKCVKHDKNAKYDEILEINLSKIEPLVAKPHSPGNIATVKQLEGLKVNQVCIGSCTNSSYRDLMTVAMMLKRKTIDPNVSLVISPGSRTIMEELARNGALEILLESGARVLECACGPCIGMGQAPQSGGVSVRTFNRNFKGRCGTKDAKVYLVNPETAAATALKGVLTDPRKMSIPSFKTPKSFEIDNSMIIEPKPVKAKIVRGPNIKPLPMMKAVASSIAGEVLIKVKDDITTDHILPAGPETLPLRSNLPAISEYVFKQLDPNFVKRAKKKKGGFIIGGENYGQGSSREHAAMAPRYLGVKAVIAKSFARIHKANLVNFGILPLVFENKKDYSKVGQGDVLEIKGVRVSMQKGENVLKVVNKTKAAEFNVEYELDERVRKIIIAGGMLNYVKYVGGA